MPNMVNKDFIIELGMESKRILAKYKYMNSRERGLHESWAAVAKMFENGMIDFGAVSMDRFEELKKEVVQESIDIRKKGEY